MIPRKTIEELISKHSLLEKDLSSTNIDKKLFAEKSKEYSEINEIITDAKKYLSFEKDKIELEKILKDKDSDKEFLKMAEMELKDLEIEFGKNEKKLKLFLLPKDEADKKMQLLKLELVQEVWKQVYLRLIFLRCMKKLVIKKNGILN